jgi:transposase
MRDHTMAETQLNSNRFTHVVAFEVSKASLLVEARPGGARREIANTPHQVRGLLRREMKRNRDGQLGPLLVVCEASGGYECHVLAVATELGLACHRAHGTRVRYFARFRGRDAKSDGLDVGVLAAYGLAGEGLRLYCPPRPEEAALRDLKTRRRELQDMLTAETNRLEHQRVKAVAASAKAVIRVLTRELAKIDAEIAALIKRDEEFRFKAGVLQQTIGVAAGVASTLLAFLPEIGTLAKTTVARLAGLAPLDNDSGTSRKPRHIHGGRAEVRRDLFMAARTALNHDPDMIAFAARLTADGKCYKVMITAVMRKLLVRLNARLRDALAGRAGVAPAPSAT